MKEMLDKGEIQGKAVWTKGKKTNGERELRRQVQNKLTTNRNWRNAETGLMEASNELYITVKGRQGCISRRLEI